MIILEGIEDNEDKMLHNQLPIPGSTSVTGQNVLTRAMGYTSALTLSVYSTFGKIKYRYDIF